MTTTLFKKNYFLKVALLSLGITIAALLPILIVNKGNLYLVGDHMTQQIPFIKEARRMFLSGHPFWSWNTFLGGNFLGTYSFYVYGSPFFWPLLLFPENYVAVGMSLMFVLKHIVAALTACLYLKKHVKNQQFAIIGGLMYAFSSFTMDSTYYYHFLDVIAFFPLLLYAVDEVLENRKKVLLAFATMLCAVTNYYFFISTSVFVLIYVVFRIKFDNKYSFKQFGIGAIFYAAGTMASFVVLLPSVLCLLETTKATNGSLNIFLNLALFFAQLIEIIKGIVLPSEGILGSASGFMLAQYCSNAAFIPFFGAFFLFSSFQMKHNDWCFKLAKFLFILSFIPLANGIFNLFTNINYTRWWYAFVLIIITVSLKVLEHNKNEPEKILPIYKKSAKAIFLILLITFVVLIIVKILAAYLLSDFITKIFDNSLLVVLDESGLLKPIDNTTLSYFAVLIIMLVANYGSLALFVKKKWVYDTRKVIAALSVICVISYGAYLINETNGFQTKLQTYDGADTVVNRSVEYDHRVQNTGVIGNYSMINNQPSISTFNSFKSHATTEFARIAGYEINDMPTTSAYFTTEAIQTVLNVSHVRNKDGSYSKTKYYVPLGYVYDYFVIDHNCNFVKDTKQNNSRIESMVYACYVDSETANEIGNVVKPLGETQIDWKEHSLELKNSAATNITMNGSGFKAVSIGEKARLLYFSVPNDKGWKAYINGKETKIYTINGGMMGIIVPSGKVDLEFRFTTPGLMMGTCVSLVTVFGLIIFLIIEKLKAKNT